MNPVLDKVASKGSVQTHNVEIRNSELFGAMANLLKNETWRTPVLNNLNISYKISDGRLVVEPILMNISRVGFEISGSQGLDMTMNYKLSASVPVSSVGSGATDLLSKIPGGSNVKDFKVTGLMGGMVNSPSVSLSVADTVGNVTGAVKEEVKVQVEEAKAQVKEEVDKQITAIMAEAEKQAENIRNTAKQTADRLRAEANAAADKLESEASSPLEKVLAKTAADKLRNEGEAAAVKTEQEAERQITALMDAARKKADSIRNN
jgi:hypothetical protein